MVANFFCKCCSLASKEFYRISQSMNVAICCFHTMTWGTCRNYSLSRLKKEWNQDFSKQSRSRFKNLHWSSKSSVLRGRRIEISTNCLKLLFWWDLTNWRPIWNCCTRLEGALKKVDCAQLIHWKCSRNTLSNKKLQTKFLIDLRLEVELWKSDGFKLFRGFYLLI